MVEVRWKIPTTFSEQNQRRATVTWTCHFSEGNDTVIMGRLVAEAWRRYCVAHKTYTERADYSIRMKQSLVLQAYYSRPYHLLRTLTCKSVNAAE